MLPALAEKFWGMEKFRLHICHHRSPYKGRATPSFERLSWLEFEGNRGSAKCQHGTVRPKRFHSTFQGVRASWGRWRWLRDRGKKTGDLAPGRTRKKVIYILPFPKGKSKVLLDVCDNKNSKLPSAFLVVAFTRLYSVLGNREGPLSPAGVPQALHTKIFYVPLLCGVYVCVCVCTCNCPGASTGVFLQLLLRLIL